MSSPIIAEVLAGRVLGSANDNFVIAEWRDAGGPAGPPRYIAFIAERKSSRRRLAQAFSCREA